MRFGNASFDPGVLDRLDLVKQIIDREPQRVQDVDDLARVAAMNRTKLRSAFKQVYGTTLSGYRTAAMLQRADCALKQAGASVQQAARRAYVRIAQFFAGLREKAEQLDAVQRWYRILSEALRKYLHGRQLIPPARLQPA